MRKTYIHIELVPVQVAEKILKKERSSAKRHGKRKVSGTKPRKAASSPHLVPEKVEVLSL